MSYGVHAPVHPVENSAPHALGNAAARDAQPRELRRGHEPMLRRREGREVWVDIPSHRDVKSTQAGHLPPSQDLYALALELHAGLTGGGA